MIGVEHLTAKDYRPEPWKNGKGQSHLIAQEGEPLLWRVSMAPVRAETAFSLFQNALRHLTLIEGDELRLSAKGSQSYRSVRVGEVLQFGGEEPVIASPQGGPVLDLGLIHDPRRVRAEFHCLRFSQKPRSFALEAPTTLVFAIEGDFRCSLYPGERKILLKPRETLILRHPKSKRNASDEALLLIEPTGAGLLAWIEIHF